MNENEPKISSASFFVHDEEMNASLDARIGDIEVLREGSSQKLTPAMRKDLIERVRKGEHHELHIQAITFRQKDGKPNVNHLRFAKGQLAKIATSFIGQPVLKDHATWRSDARLGTIVKSEAFDQGNGWTAFRQTLQIVKPDAVISALDGTLDRFSIAWRATGPVMCSVHQKNVRQRNSCGCWPGDQVEGLDGRKETVEYEYQSASGKETSGVNDPAVTGTHNEDIRVALAAELGLHHEPQEKEKEQMNFSKLAARLGLASLTETDEDRALAALDLQLSTGQTWKTRAEKAETSIVELNVKLEALKAEHLVSDVSVLISQAYAEGKLLASHDVENKRIPDPQESAMRGLASSPAGLPFLKAFIESMPKKAPVGTPPQTGDDAAKTALTDAGLEAALASAAKQLGVSIEEVRANYNAKINGGR